MSHNFCPDFKVKLSGMGEVGVSAVELGVGGSKEITSSTRMAFEGRREADRSKAPLRCDW